MDVSFDEAFSCKQEGSNDSDYVEINEKNWKKSKLVDKLNDKLASRPGVFELVKRNIIPGSKNLQEVIKENNFQYEEDSNEALSPEQLCNLTTSPSRFSLSPTASTSIHSPTAFAKHGNFTRLSNSQSSFAQSTCHPYLLRQLSKGSKMGQSGMMSKLHSTRKNKDKQQKYKKFKYHQYVPPDQQGKLDDRKSSSDDYTMLLQQQQVYLQLQLMNNQYSGQRNGDGPAAFSHQEVLSLPSNSSMIQTMKMEKTRNLNAPLTVRKLEEMKVSELKEELKQRGLKVTGTKEVLVERLRPCCVSAEKSFLSHLSRFENGSLNFSLNSSMMTERNDGLDGRIPLDSAVTSTPQTAFAIDPNIVHRHKVVRMPIPEQHTVILKQEKLTMPTWHHAGETSSQPMSSPNQTCSEGYMPGERVKDKMLEVQQKEIDNLKRMVEMQRQQLHNHQFKETIQVRRKPLHTAKVSRPVFQFPTASHTDPRQSGSSISSVSSISTLHKDADPPNYEQAYEMLNVSQAASQAAHNEKISQDVENIMASENHTQMQGFQRPPVTRVLLNDHETYYEPNGIATNITPKLYSQPKLRLHHAEYVSQDQNPMQQVSGHIGPTQEDTDNNLNFPEKDLTKLLVDSAGDALMDTSNFPPIINRYTSERLDFCTTEHSHVSTRDSMDSELIYSTSHCSHLDTAEMDTGNRDLVDLKLSTPLLDNAEPTLNALSQSNHVYASNRHYFPPKSTNLAKSGSRELLASGSPSNNSMNSSLNWLDLNLVSTATESPSAGSIFDGINFEEQNMQNFLNSHPVSMHGSQDTGLDLCIDTTTANLEYPPSTASLKSHWDNSWEGLLGNYSL